MSFFFLMCSERSGSNLITSLLNGHNNICGPATKHIINPVARNIFRYGDLKNSENWSRLVEDIFRLISVDFSIWKREFSLEDLRQIAPEGDVISLLKNIFMEEARAHGKQHVFIKENQVYEFFPFLMAYFSESKYIYQVRDPRDMALSWKKSTVHPGGVVQAARQWKHDQQQSLKNLHILRGQGKAHLLRYEDLTTNTEAEVRTILEFLGVPYDEEVFDFYKNEIIQKNAAKQKAWDNLSRGIMNNNSNKYQAELRPDEIKAVEAICRFEMNHLGYKTDYSDAELDRITDGWLEQLHQTELRGIALRRSQGVKENMAAKAQFYRR
ncbi:sulfotransferase [Marinobacteraceae bacterium S3BR75-40.1]